MSSPDASDWLEDPPATHELSQIAFTENEREEKLAVSKKATDGDGLLEGTSCD